MLLISIKFAADKESFWAQKSNLCTEMAKHDIFDAISVDYDQ
ncbi:hypothetical protein D3OALGB2SA_5520 [Olavius algarvensis associated proteobacterium Delta 3]|nr:hypothetical protein D3OALGB2SA_5520 [Olavius algarvensis associated proteobacterium Delta 3]